MDTQAQTEWLTYRRAQAYTSLSRTVLWQLINAGEIQAARVGRAVRINRESLDEFVRRHSNFSSSE
jgi:excisionase family DNA binding protein